jgi:hypothetical protein
MPDRTCSIRGGGGTPVVRLTADNLLSAGARFILVDQGNTVRAEWTMQPGDDGVDEHPLTGFPAGSLQGFWVKWVIRACMRHPSAETGTVTVRVLQDGAEMPMSPAAQWSPAQVPQCATGTAFRIEDFFDFVVQ